MCHNGVLRSGPDSGAGIPRGIHVKYVGLCLSEGMLNHLSSLHSTNVSSQTYPIIVYMRIHTLCMGNMYSTDCTYGNVHSVAPG